MDIDRTITVILNPEDIEEILQGFDVYKDGFTIRFRGEWNYVYSLDVKDKNVDLLARSIPAKPAPLQPTRITKGEFS